MNDLGTCRKDDRKSVAAVNQTARCIILSLPAGSRHTAIRVNALSALVRNNPSENIADGGGSWIILMHAGPTAWPEPPGRGQFEMHDAGPSSGSRSTASLSLRPKDSVPRLQAHRSTPDPRKTEKEPKKNFTP
jgi:hypothetical protein